MFHDEKITFAERRIITMKNKVNKPEERQKETSWRSLPRRF